MPVRKSCTKKRQLNDNIMSVALTLFYTLWNKERFPIFARFYSRQQAIPFPETGNFVPRTRQFLSLATGKTIVRQEEWSDF